MIPENISISASQFDDQGKIADYLIKTFSSSMHKTNERAIENGMPALDVEDELRAADDFYFSSVELMDCCILAKNGESIVGLACVNPYTSSLQYISVDQEYQRSGIGSRLLSLGKKVLSNRGCTHIKLDIPSEYATEGTISFFEKNKVREVSSSIRLSGGIF